MQLRLVVVDLYSYSYYIRILLSLPHIRSTDTRCTVTCSCRRPCIPRAPSRSLPYQLGAPRRPFRPRRRRRPHRASAPPTRTFHPPASLCQLPSGAKHRLAAVPWHRRPLRRQEMGSHPKTPRRLQPCRLRLKVISTPALPAHLICLCSNHVSPETEPQAIILHAGLAWPPPSAMQISPSPETRNVKASHTSLIPRLAAGRP